MRLCRYVGLVRAKGERGAAEHLEAERRRLAELAEMKRRGA